MVVAMRDDVQVCFVGILIQIERAALGEPGNEARGSGQVNMQCRLLYIRHRHFIMGYTGKCWLVTMIFWGNNLPFTCGSPE